MLSAKEDFENGHFSGPAMFRHNAATLKLESDSTGLWIIANATKHLPNFRFDNKSALICIEVFDSHGYPDEFNRNVRENSDVLSCAFSPSNRLVFRNCYAVNYSMNSVSFSGLIILESEYDANKFTAVRSFKNFNVINTGSYVANSVTFNTSVYSTLTMNSLILDPILSSTVGSFEQNSDEAEQPPITRHTIVGRFANSLSLRFGNS